MKRDWLPWFVLVGAAYFAIAGYGYRGQVRDARAEVTRLRATADSLAAVTARVDTVYRADTVRLWRTLTHYDSIRTTDTISRNDTVFVPRVVADEAVASCRAAVLTCEQRVAVRDATIATKDSLAAVTASAHRQALATVQRKRLRDALVAFGVGALAALVLAR